jgi:hypothetical protein
MEMTDKEICDLVEAQKGLGTLDDVLENMSDTAEKALLIMAYEENDSRLTGDIF